MIGKGNYNNPIQYGPGYLIPINRSNLFGAYLVYVFTMVIPNRADSGIELEYSIKWCLT